MRHLRKTLFIAALGTTFSSLSYAAAFQLYELGSPIIGTAAVGQAVVANDASVSYYNPAAMTLLPCGTEVLLGTQMILFYSNFSPNSSNTITGNNGGSAGSLIPGLDIYYVYSYDPKLKFGVSLTGPYGGALNYNNAWVGRYYVQQMQLYALDLNPAIAYQVNCSLSLGAGVVIEYANLYQTIALPVTPTISGQATVKVDNTASGFNLGALYTPRDGIKIGLTYRSKINHNLHGDISFLNLPETPSATSKLTMPANVIGSFSYEFSQQFTLLGEAGWANWRAMTNTIVNVGNFSFVNQLNWHDTYRLGLGGQYKLPCVLLQAGASYDSSPTSASKRLPDLPMDRQVRVGGGLIYSNMRGVKLGVSYEYLNLGRANINNVSPLGTLAGSYSRNYMNIIQASLNVEL